MKKSDYDKSWREWVEAGEGNEEDLALLLEVDVDGEYKKRAISLLMTPDSDSFKFFWNGGTIETISSPALPTSKKLLNFYIETLCDFMVYVRRRAGEQYKKWEDVYNYRIINIMTRTSELDAEVINKMLNLFSPADAKNRIDIRTGRGYDPFLYFMNNSNIADCYKSQVDKQMRKNIVYPGSEKREKALFWYRHLVSPQIGTALRYDQEIFVRQIKFLVDKEFILSDEFLEFKYGLSKLYAFLKEGGHDHICRTLSVNIAICFVERKELRWHVLNDVAFLGNILADVVHRQEYDLLEKICSIVNAVKATKRKETQEDEEQVAQHKKEEDQSKKQFENRLSIL